MSTPQPVRLVARPVQNPLAAWREIENTVVIISPEDSVLHELNETASFIWKQATGQLAVEEIAQRVSEEFEVDENTALADTRELIHSLCEKRLLLSEPAAGVSHG